MLRFIILRHFKDSCNGCTKDSFETLDIDAPELEHVLLSGGTAEGGYDVAGLVGVEILPPPAPTAQEPAAGPGEREGGG